MTALIPLTLASCGDKLETAFAVKPAQTICTAGETVTLTLSGTDADDLSLFRDGVPCEFTNTAVGDSVGLTGLTEGHYRAVLTGKDGEILASAPFAVTSSDFDISSETFTEGEPIHLYCEEASETAWLAVYPAGADYTSEALLWDWCADLDGPVIDLGELKRSNASLPFAAGDYEAVVFSKNYDVQSVIPFTVGPAEKASVYFESRYDEPGSAESTIYIFHGAEPAEEYAVCWGNEDGVLEDYTPVFEYTPAEDNTDGTDWYGYRTVTYTSIPRGADRLLLYAGTGYEDAFILPEELLQTGEEPLDTFAVLSDTHVTNKIFHGYNIRTGDAFKEVGTLSDSLSRIFVNGDLTDNGKEWEYSNYRRLAARAKVPVWCSIGNHDVGLNQPVYEEFVGRYEKVTGMSGLYYSFADETGTFIVLGTEDAVGLTANMAKISEEQISWFEDQLKAADPEKPVFVFLHQPLQYTMEGSGTLHVDEDAELRALMDSYPNLILFSGHTHITLQSYAVLDGEGQKASYVNTGAVSSTWATADEELDGSEGLLVEVYSDRILIRCRDFLNDQWFGGYEFMLMR